MPSTNGPSTDQLIRSRLEESAAIKEQMRLDVDTVAVIGNIATTIFDSFESGNKLFLCGNGGSAADAQHIAAELVGRFYTNREPLPAVSLAVNASTVTAIANDFSFDDVFVRQVRGLGHAGDALIGLSTSGNSENVVRAFQTAKEMDMCTIAFTGSDGGTLLTMSDHCLRVPSEDTARIQEAHITAAHIICELVETLLAV